METEQNRMIWTTQNQTPTFQQPHLSPGYTHQQQTHASTAVQGTVAGTLANSKWGQMLNICVGKSRNWLDSLLPKELVTIP